MKLRPQSKGLRGSEVTLACCHLRGTGSCRERCPHEEEVSPGLEYIIVEQGVHPDEISSSEPDQTPNPDLGRQRSSLEFRSSTGRGFNSANGLAEESPLHIAALIGSMSCVEELLTAGSDIERQDSLQATPLMKALEGGQLSKNGCATARWRKCQCEASIPQIDFSFRCRYGRFTSRGHTRTLR
jgi:hypothetical protein